jgi:hypothetical protein
LCATFYVLDFPRYRHRPLSAQAGQPSIPLLPVAEWAYDPAGDKLTLPDALKTREAELRQEAQEALAAAKQAFPTLGAGVTLQGFLFQSTGGQGNLPRPDSATVTLQSYNLPTWSEVMARDVPLPPELTQGKTF